MKADVLRERIISQANIWDTMWQIEVDKKRKQKLAEVKRQEKQFSSSALSNILIDSLNVDAKIDWESLKNMEPFGEPEPEKEELPPPPVLEKIPLMPQRSDPKYTPVLSFGDKLFSPKKESKLSAYKIMFEDDLRKWKELKASVEIENELDKKNYESLSEQINREYENALKEWEIRKAIYLLKQAKMNAKVDKEKEEYFQGLPDRILRYCESVLSNSIYSIKFTKEFNLDYKQQTKMLIVEYRLPSLDDLPKIKVIKYVKSRAANVATFYSEKELNKIFDDVICQITLRTINELFQADVILAIESIIFNGWVKSIDKGTGKEIAPCILSIQTTRNEFSSINLAKVDPKACFKTLKGVGGSKLYGLSAIAPIVQLDKEDKRFVPAYAVADSIKEGDNLAIMDWEDFEHLIREIFEKEFSQYGGEVKITQASRDWGVDAVVFDPDPLRGGKIIIQAKRYTNTVGSSAVRDLYGTVVNEGAIKGILVTTSDYGPEAYSFAKDKPLTLLNGANLLHMLAKHGHKARIDLAEAKKILAEEEKR
jgi:restriction system protein